MKPGKSHRCLRRSNALKYTRRRLDQRRAQSEMPGAGGNFQPDIATADDQDRFALLAGWNHKVDICSRTNDKMLTCIRSDRDRQRAWR